MLNRKTFRMKFVLATLVGSAALLIGCGHTVLPKQVPLVKGYETISLGGAALIVVNAEKDASDQAIATPEGGTSALRANRQAWTRALVESLSRELAKRGARLTSKAPLRMSISLPEILVSRTQESYQFKVKVLVASSTGWSKKFEGSAESELRSLESVFGMTDRLAGQALEEAIKAMLGDAEFLMQARTR